MKQFLKFFAAPVVAAILSGVIVAWAAQTNYLGTVFIADSTTPTQQLKVNSDGSINVSGSASISGFTPTPAYGTPLSVSNSSSRVALPTGTVVVAYNTGTVAAYCAIGSGSVTATTSSDYIAAGGWFAYTVGAAVDIACITASSTTTINTSGGAGLPTGTGGGGGGGSGSGGAVYGPTANASPSANPPVQIGGTIDGGATSNVATWKVNSSGLGFVSAIVPSGGIASGAIASGAIASGAVASGAVASGAFASGAISDGADVTLGTKADAKSTATDTTPVTIMQVMKEISAMEQAPASRAVTNAGTFATQSAITAASGAFSSGALASGSVASGAYASGSIATGAIVDLTNGNAKVQVPTWAGGTLGAMANYGTSPGTVLVPGVNAYITGATGLAIGSTTSGQTGSLVMGAATTYAPTATTADSWPLSLDAVGNTRIVPQASGTKQSGTANTTGTSTTLLVGAVSSERIYVQSFSCANTGANASLVSFQDGSGGTTLWTTIVPAGGGSNLSSDAPMFWTTAGNALYVAFATGSTTNYCSAAGYAGN